MKCRTCGADIIISADWRSPTECPDCWAERACATPALVSDDDDDFYIYGSKWLQREEEARDGVAPAWPEAKGEEAEIG